MGDLKFDATIKLSDIFTIISFLVVGVLAFANIKSALTMLGFRLDIVDASMEDLQRDIKSGTIDEHRIKRLEKDSERHTDQIYELQRGQGYVTEKFPRTDKG